jgi:hypothetical protein
MRYSNRASAQRTLILSFLPKSKKKLGAQLGRAARTIVNCSGITAGKRFGSARASFINQICAALTWVGCLACKSPNHWVCPAPPTSECNPMTARATGTRGKGMPSTQFRERHLAGIAWSERARSLRERGSIRLDARYRLFSRCSRRASIEPNRIVPCDSWASIEPSVYSV